MALPNVSGHEIVEPIGEAYICKSVPLDSTYTHSLNVNQLQNGLQSAITSYSKYHLIGQSFTRITNNTMRVEITANELQECNYMMIRNGDFFGNNNKWYYCFIENKEYVNNRTTDITFKVDYLLTYWNDFTIPRNFIEREHCAVADDVVGKNLVPENLELGDYIINNFYHKSYSTSAKYNVILYVPNTSQSNAYVHYDSATNKVVEGIATADLFKPGIRNGFGDYPCCLAIPVTNTNENVNKAITKLLEKNAEIINIFQISGEMYNDNFLDDTITHTITFSEGRTFKNFNGSDEYGLNGVKNKKLYNSPYRKLVVTNNNGQNCEYKWEQFSTRNGDLSNAIFSNVNAMLPTPNALVFPRYYRGKVEDFENSVMLDDFPQLNWSEDSYTKWWAQNKANFAIGLASQGIMTALTFATAGSAHSKAFSAGFGAMGIGRILAQVKQAELTPDSAKIQKNSALINVLTGHLGFTFYDMSISGYMAKIIDDYFELYGYACHEEKIPNFAIPNARRKIWNYCKMQNAQIEAQTGTGRGLPQEAQKAIEEVFNNGITLWSDIAQIGNYNNDNHS